HYTGLHHITYTTLFRYKMALNNSAAGNLSLFVLTSVRKPIKSFAWLIFCFSTTSLTFSTARSSSETVSSGLGLSLKSPRIFNCRSEEHTSELQSRENLV